MGATARTFFAAFVCFALTASTGAASGFLISGNTVVADRDVVYVKVRLDAVRMRAGLGEGLVGRTEPLAGIAKRYGAIAAINGGYFESYATTAIKNPNHTIVSAGQIVHKGDVGSIIYFDAQDRAAIARIPLRILGSLDGSETYPNTWYAYWINRLPEGTSENVTIFTPAWGRVTGLPGGPQVQVTGGVVTSTGFGSTVIPANGFVIFFRGEDAVASHLRVGRQAAYRFARTDGRDLGDFAHAQEGIGCGPRLLTDGGVTIDATGEGFADPKVLSLAEQRSMVGITQDGRWLILATTFGTLRDEAAVMQGLGAYQAMNLDGGASSGLWLRGKYLTAPGRDLNNALLVVSNGSSVPGTAARKTLGGGKE